jgi:hypothetical protein
MLFGCSLKANLFKLKKYYIPMEKLHPEQNGHLDLGDILEQ